MTGKESGTVLGCEAATVVFDSRRHGQATTALRDVSMTVARGEVVGVIGESGSGKSTLARSLIGLQVPTSGRVFSSHLDERLGGKHRRREFARHIAMVFQDPRSSLNPRRSVGAAIRDPLEVHRIGDGRSRRDTVARLLSDVGLPESFATRPVRTLSGGQLQRAALARALALQPDFIVADEPTSALDVSVQAQIINLINDLRVTYGFGMLVISHDMRIMRAMSDSILVMLNGEIVERGATARLFSHPESPYTRELIASTPLLGGQDGL